VDLTKRELENRLTGLPNASLCHAVKRSKEQQQLKSNQNQSLQDFVSRANVLVSKLRSDTDGAQNAFKECAKYYGEDTKMANCSEFFGYFVKFNAMWKTAEEENIKRQGKQSKILLSWQQKTGVKKSSQANMTHDLLKELATRMGGANTPAFIKPKPNEVQDGTFDHIILGLKSEPYRTHEGKRKSKSNESNETPVLHYDFPLF
jgi:hypothetical protein